MSHLINRIEVYTLYFIEYLKFGEIGSLVNALRYMATRKSYAKGGIVSSGMGRFETRPGSLDFQFVNYAYELDIKRFIEKEKFDVFFDIGACLGEYSVWIAKKGKRCIAFEPVSHSFNMIQRNIKLNGLEKNITACNYGLGTKHSVEYFELNDINPGSNKRVDNAGSNTEKIEIYSLDEKFSSFNLNPSDRLVIKIDVEGMELDMLRGATRFLQSFDNLVLIIEEKLSSENLIIKELNTIASFEYGKIDEHNIYARKKSNLS